MAKRIVFRKIGYRLAALAVIAVGVVAVKYYTGPHDDRYVFYVDVEPPPETEVGDRNIAEYEFGGHVPDCSVIYWGEEDQVRGDECFELREDARRFLEAHFKNQRRGYVIIDRPSLEFHNTTYFFIEPNETGSRWEIRVTFPQPPPYTRFHRNFNTAYWSEAFRRRIRNGNYLIKDGTTALVLRSRGFYELIL